MQILRFYRYFEIWDKERDTGVYFNLNADDVANAMRNSMKRLMSLPSIDRMPVTCVSLATAPGGSRISPLRASPPQRSVGTLIAEDLE